MSLQKKIEAEIQAWNEKIALLEARVKRMKLEIKTLDHLLEIAEKVEGNEH